MDASKPADASGRARNAHEYYRTLAKRIYHLRKQQQFTQAELARALGVSQQSVFSYELGDRRVPIYVVPALMRTLRVSCESLLGIAPLPPLPTAKTSPAQRRHIEQLRELSAGDRRIVMRITEALRRK